MNTPIHDFVKAYVSSAPVRLHMPGHKGRGPLGCEEGDITEIPGADSLYEAAGIIAESEKNASRLFGCPTFYSTEGSSHCIRAMLLLAMQAAGRLADEGRADPRFRVLAARNVHSAFLTAAALLDLDARWLPLRDGSYLSACPAPEELDRALEESGAAAVYLTCPDYLGFLPDLRPLAAVCHARGALLLVDNAHGAYLRFLPRSRHPMDLGADLCCDSAHKTLPVLTGGAYLHVAQGLLAPALPGEAGADRGGEALSRTDAAPLKAGDVKDALALFGSTSPSYLILQSLDLANPYLEALPERLAAFLPRVEALKARLAAAGWCVVGDEPVKLTLAASETGLSGQALAGALEQAGIFCEFADPDYAVFMLTPQNTEEDLTRLERSLPERAPGSRAARENRNTGDGSLCSAEQRTVPCAAPADACAAHPADLPETVCSIREAMLAPCERIPARESLGRVLARPGVSCPPAVPIRMPGERIDEAALSAFERYGIRECAVLRSASGIRK